MGSTQNLFHDIPFGFVISVSPFSSRLSSPGLASVSSYLWPLFLCFIFFCSLCMPTPFRPSSLSALCMDFGLLSLPFRSMLLPVLSFVSLPSGLTRSIGDVAGERSAVWCVEYCSYCLVSCSSVVAIDFGCEVKCSRCHKRAANFTSVENGRTCAIPASLLPATRKLCVFTEWYHNRMTVHKQNNRIKPR